MPSTIWRTRCSTLGRLGEAVDAFNALIALNPHAAEAYYNLAVVLARLQRHDDVIAANSKAISLQPDHANAYFNRASTLFALSRFEEALADYRMAAKLDPKINFLAGYVCHLRMRVCDWTSFDTDTARLLRRIQNSEPAASPFAILPVALAPDIPRRTAELWSKEKFSGLRPEEIPRYPRRNRIRVGYFSADFQAHATAWLAAGIFEQHDRTEFEFFAFSFGPPSENSERKRLMETFDQFIDVSAMSESDIALRAQKMQIDIGLDLKGFTHEARTGIFALRAAPSR